MINDKKIIVVMPAYNAEHTLKQTYEEIYKPFVDEIILIDDFSKDETVKISRELGIKTIVHEKNKGYGAGQKTCYTAALQNGADIVVMLHPDYQYTPKLIPAMVSMIAFGEYDIVLGSRILGNSALKGGMPLYKYIANRTLTWIENLFVHQKLSEYHTGFRAFSREVLENLPIDECDDDFIFDNEILAQAFLSGYRVGEISCPTKYFKDASSINFRRSCKYGFGVLGVSLKYRLARWKIFQSKIFNRNGKKLDLNKKLNYVE